jgi:tRNA(Ile)-lysidine synthase
MRIPKEVCVAVSGGADSMAVVDFLKQKHRVKLIHFNHGTAHGKEAEYFVRHYAKQNELDAEFGYISSSIPKGVSKEDFWRKERYDFFEKVVDGKLILAHNLDDAVETWLFTSINGNPKLIPAQRDYVIRPFILNKKSELRSWCEYKGVGFLDDPANKDLSYARVRLRENIIPEILKVNPGIYKVIAKKYLEEKTFNDE